MYNAHIRYFVVIQSKENKIPSLDKIPFDPFNYKRRQSFSIGNIGAENVPVVIADFHKKSIIKPRDLESIGYMYNEQTDKWNIADRAVLGKFHRTSVEI